MTPKEIITRYWNAEMTRDMDSILENYNKDAVMVVPGMGLLSGIEEIRDFYQKSIDRFPRLSVEIKQFIEEENRGAFEWQSLFHDHEGNAYPSRGVNFIETRDDRLQRVHVFFDSADLE